MYRILEQIVQPPTFWNTLCQAHNVRMLTLEGSYAFAWLLLELLCSRLDDIPDVRGIAEQVSNNESLLNSEFLEVRNIGHKIKHVLVSTSEGAVGGAGGRHDNDFCDYREIKILPTPDEFASLADPFYRRADAVNAAEPEDRGSMHLDNQFRLLREDLLGELRTDYQIATDQKKGRRKKILTDLKFAGMDCGPVTRQKLCTLKLQCSKDIPQLSKIKGVKLRNKFITDTKSLMKHGSFGCFTSDGRIVAFANVDRNEELLAQEPSIAVFRVADPRSLCNILMICKTSTDLNFIQVETAVFAYEPILQCLQSMVDMPLDEQLLNFTPKTTEALSGIQPSKVINAINNGWGGNLQNIIGTIQPVQLDSAQTDSLVAGLSKRVSLIQGPPGKWTPAVKMTLALVDSTRHREVFHRISYSQNFT